MAITTVRNKGSRNNETGVTKKEIIRICVYNAWMNRKIKQMNCEMGEYTHGKIFRSSAIQAQHN